MAMGCLGGCAVLATHPLALPDQYTVVRGQLCVHSDFPLPANHRLLEELTVRQADLEQKLGLPGSDEPIHIYLFENGDQFHQFVRLRYPGFPRRRAFFVETDTYLRVYAQWGDHLAEDLRHEVTHGYLHSVIPDIPLWLDEGLAEYCEVPRSQQGLNRAHWEHLAERARESGWRPDLVRLEHLEPSQNLSQTDYAEAWAWVHFLLESGSERLRVLREYLAEIRQKGGAPPLSVRLARLDTDPTQALLAHLDRLAGRIRPGQFMALAPRTREAL